MENGHLKRAALAACAAAALALAASPAAAGRRTVTVRSGTTPVTAACVLEAARAFGMPAPVLLAIMRVEAGTVGMWAANGNGTWDMGPMQVNTCHAGRLAGLGLRPAAVAGDGCLNVMTAAWLLRGHYDRTGSMVEAIGLYHSARPDLAREYVRRVVRALGEIAARPEEGLRAVIGRSNRREGP
jgi:soluble lytic murein transglycosylase-like protein